MGIKPLRCALKLACRSDVLPVP